MLRWNKKISVAKFGTCLSSGSRDHRAFQASRSVRSSPSTLPHRFAQSPSTRHMVPQAKRCSGCLKLFTSQRVHLAKTSNPLCRALAKKRKSSCLGFIRQKVPQRNSQLNNQPPSALQNSSPAPTNDAASQPEHTHAQDLSPASDEDEWNEELDDEEDLYSTSESSPPGWEPPIPNDTDNMSVSSDNTDSSPSPSASPESIRERTWVEPKVVKFPNPRAGKPVRSVNSTNDTYAASLGNGSDSNPYRPFTSKIDWEVAKWAKLRGPSSTSLADLLKIEGVMLSHVHQ